MVRKHGDASPQPGEAMSWSRPRRLGDGVNIAARLIGILLRRMSLELVESRCGAVALGRTYLLPPLSSGGASMVPPWLRFHIPLIGRVEGWRADSVRDTSTVPRFQPPPRRTQHADFPHCAPPFASCRGL